MTFAWVADLADQWLGTAQGAYVDWWRKVEREGMVRDVRGLRDFYLTNESSVGPERDSHNFVFMEGIAGQADSPEVQRLAGVIAPQCLPQSSGAGNQIAWSPDFAPEMTLPDDPIILGIIDSDIALTHERFRGEDGKSRILAAWLMGETFGGPPDVSPIPTPYGREVWKPEIDAAMGQDEAGAELVLGTGSLFWLGSRGTMMRAAHGTHVLDLAAGTDPQDRSPAAVDMRKRVVILAVGLPSDRVIGPSGTFLEPFVLHALQWIRLRATALAKPQGLTPVVVNLSYGLAAGPRDITGILTREIAFAAREDGPTIKTRLLMPAGNNNLDQGNARIVLDGHTNAAGVDWLVVPDDLFSTYAEVWLPPDTTGLTLLITPPGGLPTCVLKLGSLAAKGEISVLSDGKSRLAAAYWLNREPDMRKGLVLCIAPTRSLKPGRLPAPPGVWKVALSRAAETGNRVEADLQLQSERPLVAGFGPWSPSRLRGDEGDALFDRHGDLEDTYRYPKGHPAPGDMPTDAEPPRPAGGWVRRKGTLNALAVATDALIIGGHRVSDGMPVRWSASGDESVTEGVVAPTFRPTRSYPATESPMLRGLIAAGHRSGSVAVVEGTSFSTALATRELVLGLLADPAAGKPLDDDHGGSASLSSIPLKAGAAAHSALPTRPVARR